MASEVILKNKETTGKILFPLSFSPILYSWLETHKEQIALISRIEVITAAFQSSMRKIWKWKSKVWIYVDVSRAVAIYTASETHMCALNIPSSWLHPAACVPWPTYWYTAELYTCWKINPCHHLCFWACQRTTAQGYSAHIDLINH